MALQRPLKYFDVYKQRPTEDARAGISTSSSTLQLVPKGAKHSSRERRLKRSDHDRAALADDHKSLKNTYEVPAVSGLEPVPLTVAALARHTTALRLQDSPPDKTTHESVNNSNVAQDSAPKGLLSHQLTSSTNVSACTVLPTKLAVPAPFDIFAGQGNPVSAEALADSALSCKRVALQVSSNSTNLGGEPVLSSQEEDDVQSRTCYVQVEGSTGPITASNSKVIPSIEDIIRQHGRARAPMGTRSSASSPPVPSIPSKFRYASDKILSIDEIVSKHQKVQAQTRKCARSAEPALASASRPRSRTTTADSDISQSRSSVDSVTGEILHSIQQQTCHLSPRTLYHAKSQPSFSTPDLKRYRHREPSIFSDSPLDISNQASPLTSASARLPSNPLTTDDEITRYLRSARLTRLLTLRRPPNHHLVVSLADVGREDGHPVVVYLGLGSVRYLVALYDDLAASLGLRLICIDRWGLGKTGEVPDSRRGFHEWSYVVEEVLDQLGIGRFSILAHSAGTPYALASSIRLQHRVRGTIHLLAPWVGSAAESTASAYKWLRFIPSGVLKTAQAAEWRMQGWRLGKNPKIQAQGVGFDPRAPLSSDSAATSPIFAGFNLDIPPQADTEARQHPAHSTTPSQLSVHKDADSEKSANGSLPSASTRGQHRKSSSGAATDHRTQAQMISSSPGLHRRASNAAKAPSTTASSVKSQVTLSQQSIKLELGTALMRASHAESLKGGTSDLLAILHKTGKTSELSYSEIAHPVRVWHGLKDDKISLESVLSLETFIPDCKVNVIPGADHSLMTNVAVFLQVLQAIAGESDVSSRL